MRKRAKLTYLIFYLVLVLALAGNASAYESYQWDGGGPNTLWNEPLNWDDGVGGDGVPTSADFATLNIPDANCLIDSNVAAACMLLRVGDNDGPCYLNMTGGTLAVGALFEVAENSNSIGTFTMTGGTVTSGNRLKIAFATDWRTAAADTNAVGTFIMTGGEFTIPNEKIELAKNDISIGYMYMHGGTLQIGDDFELGNYGNATMEMTGGDVNVVDTVKLAIGGSATVGGVPVPPGTATIYITDGNILCDEVRLGEPEWPTGNATIYLGGGDINCGTINIDTVNGKIDINEGTLVVREEITEEDKVEQYVSEGMIVGYGGNGIVDINNTGEELIITARLGDPNLAWDPGPGRYATVQWTPAGPTLTWRPGRYAADANEHDVYFGTDEDDVTDANRADDPCGVLVSQGQDPCTYPFPAPPPVLDRTYYWRIDEVNDACAPYLWKGDVWYFQMAGYIVVEDFESYASADDLNDVWILTGSDIIDINDTIVKPKSAKSMKYEYDNTGSPYYTEAVANTTGPNSLQVIIAGDWTAAEVKALTLYFYGSVGNDAEQIYVALKDTDSNTAVVYYDGDPNDINEPEWHEWNIELSDFNSPDDVNLSDVNKVYIGFGNRQSPAAGGTGTVYFDDIRLYPRRCVPLFGPAGDIAALGGVDNDCYVDLVDFSVMTDDWREKDSTRVGSDADVNGTWVNDAQRGRCVQLDGINDWVDLDDSDFSNFRNKTIAFWVKVMNYPTPPYRYMFYFTDEDEDNPYRIYFMTYTPEVYAVRVRFVEDYSQDFYAGEIWTHLAFVLEDTPDGRCTGKFYVDGGDGFTPGLPYDTMPGRPRHSEDANGVNLGSFQDGDGSFVNARFDDFRVYDYALSGSEIADLYNATKVGGGGSAPDANMLVHYEFDETSGLIADNNSPYQFYHPLLSDAELYEDEEVGSREVNFKDLAILVNDWLQEKLWP